VTPIEFVRPMHAGKTNPLLIVCETADGGTVEVVAKLSIGCEEGVTGLAREVVAACLARDLGLPIPEPFLIEISAEWTAALRDTAQQSRIAASSPIAFGSTHLTGQYAVWHSGNRISPTMLPTAAAIFVFDGIIQNPDRREGNPNCLVKGDELRIFDHELTFMHGRVVGWQAPWDLGGLGVMQNPGFHIFREQLRHRGIDFDAIRSAWESLSDARIGAYLRAVPDEWAAAIGVVQSAQSLIGNARDNMDGCIVEVQRVLE